MKTCPHILLKALCDEMVSGGLDWEHAHWDQHMYASRRMMCVKAMRHTSHFQFPTEVHMVTEKVLRNNRQIACRDRTRIAVESSKDCRNCSDVLEVLAILQPLVMIVCNPILCLSVRR